MQKTTPTNVSISGQTSYHVRSQLVRPSFGSRAPPLTSTDCHSRHAPAPRAPRQPLPFALVPSGRGLRPTPQTGGHPRIPPFSSFVFPMGFVDLCQIFVGACQPSSWPSKCLTTVVSAARAFGCLPPPNSSASKEN
jgi:hypothetical protein